MALLEEVDKLLAIDGENISIAKDFLRAHPGLLEALSSSTEVYDSCRRLFGKKASERFGALYERATKLGSSTIEDLSRLPASAPAARREEARTIQGEIFATENRGMLLARMSVLHSQSICDLLRFRVTHPLASTRLLCESMAYMEMMRSPEVAIEWRNLRTDEDGQRFYRRHSKTVTSTLKLQKLKFAYDNASGIAMHSRFAGVALGLEPVPTGDGYQIQVKAQEIDGEHPQLYLLIVLHILRVQDRIFDALGGLPEMDDPLYRRAAGPNFHKRVDALFNDFAKNNVTLVARYNEDFGEDP